MYNSVLQRKEKKKKCCKTFICNLSLAEFSSNDILNTLPFPRGFPIPPAIPRSWLYSKWSGLTWWAHGLREAASGVWKVTFFPWTVAPMLWLFPHQSWFPQCSGCAWRGNGKRGAEDRVGDELTINTSPVTPKEAWPGSPTASWESPSLLFSKSWASM